MLGDAPDVVGKRMFGGIAFLVAGNMACGVMGDDLLVRVGKEDQAVCSPCPSCDRWRCRRRTMGGFVVVDAEGLAEDDVLEEWLERGCAYAGSLPPK